MADNTMQLLPACLYVYIVRISHVYIYGTRLPTYLDTMAQAACRKS